MIQHIFTNFYYRLFIAFLICLMITFIDKFEMFHQKAVTVFLFALVVLILLSNMREDYGLLLLLIALFVLSFNISVFKNSKPVIKPSAIPKDL